MLLRDSSSALPASQTPPGPLLRGPGLQLTGSGMGVMTQQEDTGTDFLLDSNQGLGKPGPWGPDVDQEGSQ